MKGTEYWKNELRRIKEDIIARRKPERDLTWGFEDAVAAMFLPERQIYDEIEEAYRGGYIEGLQEFGVSKEEAVPIVTTKFELDKWYAKELVKMFWSEERL